LALRYAGKRCWYVRRTESNAITRAKDTLARHDFQDIETAALAGSRRNGGERLEQFGATEAPAK